jgi:hypothetical protein
MIKLSVYRGEEKKWTLQASDENGAIDLTDAVIYVTIRKTVPASTVTDDTDAVIAHSTIDGHVVVTDGPGGEFDFDVTGADTYAEKAGEYVGGIEAIEYGNTDPTTLGEFDFTIEADIVRTV